jgi:rhodanese-related sulfurtransferase
MFPWQNQGNICSIKCPMKHITKYLLILFLLGSFVFVSCKKDESEPAINESELLATHLESADSPLGIDYVNTELPAIIPASEVNILNNTNRVYIIDIRSGEDYNKGHISNAVNVSLAGIYDHLKSINIDLYDKVAIVCYTGQTSGYATSLMRLMGYSKVFSMKFGMCAWNSFFTGGWDQNIGNNFTAEFTSASNPKAEKGAMPVLNTGKKTAHEILESRLNSLLSEGFGNSVASMSATSLFGNLSNYYIINYWPENQYNNPGHVPGAIQYTPKESMKLATDLKTLPNDKAIAVYCYTGQTSAQLAAYLRLLGYNAKSVLYGTNTMIYDLMVANSMPVFSAAEVMEYDFIEP